MSDFERWWGGNMAVIITESDNPIHDAALSAWNTAKEKAEAELASANGRKEHWKARTRAAETLLKDAFARHARLTEELAEAKRVLEWYGDICAELNETMHRNPIFALPNPDTVKKIIDDNGQRAREFLKGASGEVKRRELPDELREKIEQTMTYHWDMKSCECLVCEQGRLLGCAPREKYLPRNKNRT